MIALAGVAFHCKIYSSSASVVYRGIRVQDGRAIIVKLLKQDYPSPEELIRYRQEYEITRSLKEEGVIKAYSQQDYQRTLVILLEDFGGESIERWMRQQPNFCPIPLSNFLRLAIDITDILGRIHAAGVIHKDINPSNIVLNPNTGVVKIIDFGIATRFNRTNPTFKSPHVLEGTLAYLSPEQTGRMNRLLDYRTDFYSLGVTFYELLTGQLPFLTTDILELVHCHIAKPPIPPHEVNAAIPKPVSDIILKLMAKNAEDRYQSAWGIKADLERCTEQFTTTGQIAHIQLGLQDVSDQFQIPQKLYGREAEIAALLAAFERVAPRGNVGEAYRPESGIENPRFKVEMMLVSGYAGIGKSALVQELYKPLTANRGYFISGKFDQFRRNIPYSAIVDALQKLVQQLLGEPDEQVQQWRSRLLTALGSNGQIIIDVIPEVELIIGRQLPVPEVGATEAQNRFNRVFQQFIRVFCSQEHPLVIFLDDLQWADSATLKLIELMMLDEQTQFLFLIGAYRDNEVNPAHPLALTLERLRKQRAVLQEIILAPLTLLPLSQLIAETLHQNTDTVRSLAELVLHKTEGNPFFVGEFLKMLYGENLLTFDAQQLSWQWNLAEIEAQNITDNVVELLLRQLQKLPEATQQILSIAACTGAEFDLETLAIVCEKSPKAIFQDLLEAIQAGLIQPLSDLDEDLLVQEYKFSHDRVQQAAYALIDESCKQVVHLQIGRNLLEKTSPEQRLDRLFTIVDHLDQGTELVTAQPERTEIARLNLTAGQKAKGATAYEAAFKYFTTGLQLLDTESWQSEYDLTLALYSEAAEAAYLQGRFDEMEQLVEVVLNRAKTAIDKVQVYDSKIQGYLSQGDLKEALKTGSQALKLLGIDLIENPSQADIQRELESTATLLAQREIKDLINLPEMTAPEPLAAMSILASMRSVAFITLPPLWILITFKTVNLSINYGNAIWSSLFYAGYGFVLCGVVQDIEFGYEFGKLALGLAERLNARGNARTLMFSNVHIMHWKVHFRNTIPMLADAYQNGVETGDFETAGYAAYYVCYNSFFAGEELTQLKQKTAVYSKSIDQIRRESPSNWLAILRQTILNLQDRPENSSRLVSRLHNEEQALSHAIAVKDGTAIQILYLHKVMLCYLFEEHHQAEQTAILARQHFEDVTAITVLPIFCFYHSLALLSLSLEASNSEKAAWLSCVSSNQEKMQKWASYAPMNYLHKFYLVEAEKARVSGQFFEAEELYERAIAGAAENEYIQEEALAYELAAKHYLARDREKIAQTYMKEAHYCYDRWGATAKVKDLEKRYPQLLNTNLVRQSHSIVTNETIRHPTAAIDLAAVMKAAQALSEIIHLDRLIATLMQVVIENAGAETGALVLLEEDQPTVMAQCSGSRQCDLEKLAVADCATIPVSVIRSVERTQETLVLDDAVSEPPFSTDPYIQKQQTRSLLCMPILKQNQLIGILYLENNLSAGVFTRDRLQVLKLLIAQAAISLENARLYEQLEDYAETLERKVEERTQALQQEIAERQQTEAALRQSEANYRNLLQTANSVIIRYDPQGRIRYINDYGVKLLGYEGHQILGRTLFETIIPDIETSGRDVKPFVHDLLRNPQLYPQGEGENLCRDGRRVWMTWSNQAIFNEQGDVVEILSVGNDTTQRKQAEEALQRSEAKFRTIFENSQVGIYRTRLCDGLILEANQRFADLFGFDSPEEVIGLKHTTDCYVNPSDRQQAIELLKRDGELQNFEVQLQKRDGTLFWGLCSTRLNAADECIEGVIADISKQQAALHERKQAEEALQASETKLRTLIEAIPDPLFVLSAEGRLLEIMVLEPNLLWQPFEEMIGQTMHQLGKEQADEFLNYIQQVLRTQQILTVEYGAFLNGREAWFSARIAPISHDQVIWLARDITALKQAEEASILEERNRIAREIHDTLAQAFTGILAQVGAANQVLTDDVEATQAHLNLIKELARTGLSEARRSVVALRPQLLEEGSLQSALHRLIAQIRTAAMDTTLYYETEGIVYSLPTEVESNLLRMGQEALTNAIRHANADEIRVELIYDRDQVCLRVQDNGQGFGVGSISASEGFGLLGMSERAERIGAQLTIRSQPGQGTDIIVTVNRE
ncbi:serine/threonine protein kinase and signal transduction histidine kinase with GAF and PAS/PAC sensor (plasmid) [Scytonema sp. HK-05]|uniref:PAS domain S-box protein n=1 Tax=Scytonema sp. HK-05 TaxID=1137095 RepID=UPI000936C564|nr:PAS domain S-box protein [Scytonema sp. HK-05]OKH53013.1 serine/threonine protein kinase [Scytonema sp. HK-05]BAY50361.1 serine/threonine protein kinase and signal transduction histidine kinase with GAF and PAS/PAC sensor [Scytonema sp. HK-05]